MTIVNIKLDDGRFAQLTQFWAKATYDGFIEGDLEVINGEICRSFRERALRISKIDAPLHVVLPTFPLTEPLPAYICVAYLESVGAVRGERGDLSYLGLAWLGDALAGNLVSEITSTLKAVSWDAAASSAAWVDYL